ncbi:acyl-CoA-binding domain-containing protein 4 [Eudromia elegans]
MEEPSCGAQFRAAVRVIQGLPRSGERRRRARGPRARRALRPRRAAGSYRPSYEELLRFYSYYKQATAGRCQGPRPGFWDPIGRYKWDAWHSLGRMSKEEAMAAYVAEMKKVAQKVIDTVPMDEATREVLEALAPLYEVIRDLPRPPAALLPRRAGDGEQVASASQDGQEGSPAQDRLESPLPEEEEEHGEQVAGGGRVPSDSEGDVYCDTLEHVEPEQGEQEPQSDAEGDAAGDAEPAGLSVQVAGTVRALQDDMQRVQERLRQLETLAAAQSPCPPSWPGTWPGWAPIRPPPSRGDTVAAKGQPQPQPPRLLPQVEECEAHPELPLALQPPWPLPASPRTLLFLLAWPFVAQWLLRRLQRGKR